MDKILSFDPERSRSKDPEATSPASETSKEEGQERRNEALLEAFPTLDIEKFWLMRNRTQFSTGGSRESLSPKEVTYRNEITSIVGVSPDEYLLSVVNYHDESEWGKEPFRFAIVAREILKRTSERRKGSLSVRETRS